MHFDLQGGGKVRGAKWHLSLSAPTKFKFYKLAGETVKERLLRSTHLYYVLGVGSVALAEAELQGGAMPSVAETTKKGTTIGIAYVVT